MITDVHTVKSNGQCLVYSLSWLCESLIILITFFFLQSPLALPLNTTYSCFLSCLSVRSPSVSSAHAVHTLGHPREGPWWPLPFSFWWVPDLCLQPRLLLWAPEPYMVSNSLPENSIFIQQILIYSVAGTALNTLWNTSLSTSPTQIENLHDQNWTHHLSTQPPPSPPVRPAL